MSSYMFLYSFEFKFLYTYVILQIFKDIKVLKMYNLVILMYIIKSLFT